MFGFQKTPQAHEGEVLYYSPFQTSIPEGFGNWIEKNIAERWMAQDTAQVSDLARSGVELPYPAIRG
tara:strand:+ start:152 stop:352 length:201 start_codon:yes stop_codon:yes gene_type:complete